MLSFSESTTVSAAIIAKIPIVTPANERMVRVKLCVSAFNANLKLSKTNFIKSNSQNIL